MELLFLYFWLKLDVLIAGLTVAAAACIFYFVGVSIWAAGEYLPSAEDFAKKARKQALLIFIPVVVLAGAIPNRTETAILVAGHYAIKIGSSPEAAKIVSVLRKKANDILDKELAK